MQHFFGTILYVFCLGFCGGDYIPPRTQTCGNAQTVTGTVLIGQKLPYDDSAVFYSLDQMELETMRGGQGSDMLALSIKTMQPNACVELQVFYNGQSRFNGGVMTDTQGATDRIWLIGENVFRAQTIEVRQKDGTLLAEWRRSAQDAGIRDSGSVGDSGSTDTGSQDANDASGQ